MNRLPDDEAEVHVLGAPPGVVARILTRGATVASLEVPAPDGPRQILLDPRVDPDAYVGVTVGRVANRIAGSSFTLEGRVVTLLSNEGDNTLHGGPDGFDRRVWRTRSTEPDVLELELVSPDGDQGFPGELTVVARFAVTPDGLRTTYRAWTTALTPVNLTSHLYLNLDRVHGPVDGQQLLVPADRYLPVDAEGIPAGIAHVEPATDLRRPRSVGELGSFDHTYVVPGSGLRPVAELRSTSGDLTVEVATDQPGLHVFTGLSTGTGVALEPQNFPDAVHHFDDPDWPSPLLAPGEEYHWESEIRATYATNRQNGCPAGSAST